ncbi:hypothetical protein BGZ46_007413 [Entomortierella lignicola]|nr:hypothetical protein BGZ46_007413 [Entomortierella lignicola]
MENTSTMLTENSSELLQEQPHSHVDDSAPETKVDETKFYSEVVPEVSENGSPSPIEVLDTIKAIPDQAPVTAPSADVAAPSTSLPDTTIPLSPSSSISSISNIIAPVPAPATPIAAVVADNSFYSGLELDLEATSPKPSSNRSSSTPPSFPSGEPSSPFSDTVTSPTTGKFGTKKVRANPGSNISRRITMLAAGKNENNSDLYTTGHTSASGRESPDPADFPDSLFEELLRQDQAAAAISRSATTTPKPAPRLTPTHKSSLPIRLPSNVKNTTAMTDSETAFVSSGDPEEDLRRLEIELVRAKETKAKAEADAKDQRVTMMSLKTELQLVRNVLKRRETELGDVKDLSSIYESDLAELRQKLEKAERQLSKGQGETDAKVRALERLRDESIARIQTLDQEIKKLREQLQEAEKKNIEAQAEITGLKLEMEELIPFREAAAAQRELTAEEPAKVKELSLQITDLEDTRDMQAALIEELETKISTVEAEALEFKGKAELEYEMLSDGFKVLKSRRSEEIKVLKAELEQHKLQEQIIEKLQADIDQLQSALANVATSQTTENARINQVTAELNEALALKDQEVIQVRQNMTEFEDSHNRLVSSLQATLATINDEADAARKSRDEAVSALESLREELEALRHSLPINKHMSLSQWSAEQQQSQQEQLQAIRDLEEKLDGQVEGVKEDQQRAGILEANTKRRSQQLTLDMEHHLQLSSAIVKKSSENESEAEKSPIEKDNHTPSLAEMSSKDIGSPVSEPTVSVRTMLKFLSQLQGRSSDISDKGTHLREGTEATIVGDNDLDYESQLRVYLTNLNDASLIEPWAKEKKLEGEISELEQRIQNLLSDLTTANQKSIETQNALKTLHEAQLQEERDQRDELDRLEKQEREEIEQAVLEERRLRDEEILKQQQSLESKEQELSLKESSLREKELSLTAREQELVEEEEELKKKADSYPMTPPLSAPVTPFGSPGNNDLLPGLMAAHQRSFADNDATQQIKLIKTLEEKIAELEKRQAQSPPADDSPIASFPSPPTTATPRSSTVLSRISSQTMRSSLMNSAPDTPPPTIALPPIPTESSPASDDAPSPPRKKSSVIHSVSSELMTCKAAAAATEAAVAAAIAKSQEAQKELTAKLERSEAELNKSLSKNKDLETELTNAKQAIPPPETQKLKQENTELAQVLEEIRKSLDQAQSQVRGLESLKTQLESQLQKEKQAKDEALRTQDRLQARLEEEMQKKKGFLCF